MNKAISIKLLLNQDEDLGLLKGTTKLHQPSNVITQEPTTKRKNPTLERLPKTFRHRIKNPNFGSI